MFKFSIFLIVVAFTASAQARDIVCVDITLQDSSLSAKFLSIDSAKPSVQLAIPSGETGVKVLNGQCRPDPGADELAISCTVFTSTDSGYDVKLFSEGSPALKASIKAWSMIGPTSPKTVLPCESL